MRRLRCVLLISAVIASFCLNVEAKPIKLEHKFKPGDACRYKMIVTTTGIMGVAKKGTQSPVDAKLVLLLNQKVLSVSKDGTAKVSFAVDSMKLTMPGMAQPMDMGKMPAITMLMTKHGETKIAPESGQSGAVSGMPGFGGQFSGTPFMGGTVLPKRPVSVGQTWSQKLPAPMTGKALYKLVSDSVKVGNQTACKVAYTMSGFIDTKSAAKSAGGAANPAMLGNQEKIPFDGRFAIYLSPKTGKDIRTDGVMTMKMTVPMPGKDGKTPPKPTKMDLSMKMEMFRIN